MFGAKVEIAVREKGVDAAIEFVPFSLGTLYDPKHPEVARVNPKKQVPVLIDDGLELFDSTQIFEYLEDRFPDPPLWPRDVRERARARLIELKSDELFFPNVIALMPNQRAAAGEEKTADAVRAIHAYYGEMNERLATREFLAGSLSYADIAFFMAQFFASFLGQPYGEGRPHLAAWRARMRARESVKSVAGKMANYLGGFGITAQEV
jgi:glutathione S-transferase